MSVLLFYQMRKGAHEGGVLVHEKERIIARKRPSRLSHCHSQYYKISTEQQQQPSVWQMWGLWKFITELYFEPKNNLKDILFETNYSKMKTLQQCATTDTTEKPAVHQRWIHLASYRWIVPQHKTELQQDNKIHHDCLRLQNFTLVSWWVSKLNDKSKRDRQF